nr:hypothetical protein [Tanacetum cinerariifolium]
MELKKILIENIENNKSIHRSDEQRNLYKALVDAYECDTIILDTYGDKVTLKRCRDDADKDEKPSVGSDRGSKRRREGKLPKSTSAPKEKASKTTGKFTEGFKSHHKTASESVPVEEPMQTTQDLEDPSHQEFETGAADDQPIVEDSQHPEWVDVPVLTIIVPLLVTAPTIPSPTIPLMSQVQQALAPTPTTTPNSSLQDLPNFGSLFGFDHRLKTLDANFFEFMQTNQFVEAVSAILDIVDRYIDHRMHEAIKLAVQL